MLWRFCKKQTGHARPFNIPLAAERGKENMTRKKDNAKQINWKELMAKKEDFCGHSAEK
jgi:hypothetical protein